VEQLDRLRPLQEHGGSAAQQVNSTITAMKILALALAALLPCLAADSAVDKGRTMGNPSAPLLFELYSDFMCPACKHVHENVLPAIILDYVNTGKAYLVFREFPLNIPAHVYSRQSAALAVAAARVGKYQAVSDVLFRNQQTWSVSGKYWDTVASVLTPEEQKKVQALANDPAVLAEVQRDVDRVKTVLTQTPTVMITYKLKQQPWTQFGDYTLFRGYIDGLLKK
jgi:protein-disulfide isomerase